MFNVEMSHGVAAVKSRAVDDGTGEIAVETHFGQNGTYGRALNGVALFVREISGDETVNEAGKPDMPERGVGFGTSEEGVADGICPGETFGAKTVELFGFSAGGSFHMTEGFVCFLAVAVGDDCDVAMLIVKVNEIETESFGGSNSALAVVPIP